MRCVKSDRNLLSVRINKMRSLQLLVNYVQTTTKCIAARIECKEQKNYVYTGKSATDHFPSASEIRELHFAFASDLPSLYLEIQ